MSTDPRASLQSNGIDFTPTIHKDTYPAISPLKQNLQGLHVLITGASKGIGRATTLSYAAAGVSAIVIAARSDLKELEREIEVTAGKAGREKPKVVSLKLDVRSKEDVEKAAEVVKKELGHLDIIINNAGFLEPFVPLLESDPDSWWNSYETNLKGPYLILRYFLPLLLSSPTPNSPRATIGISSIGAHLLSPGASAYQSNKLALLRLHEFIDSEYGPSSSNSSNNTGVVALCVHPGGVVTELAKGMPEQMHAMLTDSTALAGDTIVWLSAKRREWLAGRYVSVTWDVEELEGKRESIVGGDLLKVRMAVV